VAHRGLHTVTFVTKDDEGMRRLGAPEITTHSFRKTVATLIDDEGLLARVGTDHLGHPRCRRPRTGTWLVTNSTRRWLTFLTEPSPKP
jgi:integrase